MVTTTSTSTKGVIETISRCATEPSAPRARSSSDSMWSCSERSSTPMQLPVAMPEHDSTNTYSTSGTDSVDTDTDMSSDRSCWFLALSKMEWPVLPILTMCVASASRMGGTTIDIWSVMAMTVMQ